MDIVTWLQPASSFPKGHFAARHFTYRYAYLLKFTRYVYQFMTVNNIIILYYAYKMAGTVQT